jgi:hypothetical protein
MTRTLLQACGWVALAAGSIAAANEPLLRPVHAFVLEGDAVDLPWAHGAGPGDLDTLGIVTEDGIELAWSERRPEALRLVFRSAADGPRSVRSLDAVTPAGAETRLLFGSIVVVPTPAPVRTGLAVAFGAHDGEGALIRSLRIENRGDEAQRLRSLAFASPGVGRGPLVVAQVAAAAPRSTGLVPRLPELRASLAERLSDARALPAEATEEALRELLPGASYVAPDALALDLGPGEAIDLLLTRANYAVDLASVHVLSTLVLSGSDADGRPWTMRLSTPVRAGPGW